MRHYIFFHFFFLRSLIVIDEQKQIHWFKSHALLKFDKFILLSTCMAYSILYIVTFCQHLAQPLLKLIFAKSIHLSAITSKPKDCWTRNCYTSSLFIECYQKLQTKFKRKWCSKTKFNRIKFMIHGRTGFIHIRQLNTY